ncbi:hypothetical protein LMH73_027770 [Vibrio splendidus]|nr:hypothetical protein [Vibrio splendidus]MCC4882521.1 hypothetical protein [Vibrio splendidus]
MKDKTTASFELALTPLQSEWSLTLLQLLNWINLSDCLNLDECDSLINKKISDRYSDVHGSEDFYAAVETIFEVSGEPKESFLDMRLFDADETPNGIKIYGQYIAEDFLAAFVQVIIKRFNLNAKGYSIANYCDDLLVDSFGGSAFYITSSEIRSINTQAWLDSK